MSTPTSDPPPAGAGATRCTSVAGPTRHVHDRSGPASSLARIRAGTGTTPSSLAAPRAPGRTSGSPRPHAPRRCGAQRDQRAGRAMSAHASSGVAALAASYVSTARAYPSRALLCASVPEESAKGEVRVQELTRAQQVVARRVAEAKAIV